MRCCLSTGKQVDYLRKEYYQPYDYRSYSHQEDCPGTDILDTTYPRIMFLTNEVAEILYGSIKTFGHEHTGDAQHNGDPFIR